MSEPIDDAWAEANAVMPGAWRVRNVTDLAIGGPPNDHVATAVSIGMLKAGTCNGYGDSPSRALRALTARLREKRDGAA
jgi:hypothetical protein